MNLKKYYDQIPDGSVIGINYSGMHDSALAVIDHTGEVVFGISLERISRLKQDGSPPVILIDNIPWDRIDQVAISTNKIDTIDNKYSTQYLSVKLEKERHLISSHKEDFHNFLSYIPLEKNFVCHQISHAASAFYASNFDSALCMTYDGGMHNCQWFGGIYNFKRNCELKIIDQFDSCRFAKITTLYTFITALLGFLPNRHEGKVTGLAAYGRPTTACWEMIDNWFRFDYNGIESTMEWKYEYLDGGLPRLIVKNDNINVYRDYAKKFSREEISATIQEYTERHIVDIINLYVKNNNNIENLCLAGGLFSNVKLNQKIATCNINKLFVAPAMTDDGTALGAAWHILSYKKNIEPKPLKSMYIGPYFSEEHIVTLLNKKNIKYQLIENAHTKIAELLNNKKICAIFQGAMEFGPRALGNRSILSQGTDVKISEKLNFLLNRNDFMPFAPIVSIDDAEQCFLKIENVGMCLSFMTITAECTDQLKNKTPAVVHVDGTSRPQLVDRSNIFLLKILNEYKRISNCLSLINTSFNVHEEPIVCTPEDAIRGFFEAGLDFLCFEGKYLISFEDNLDIAIKILKDRIFNENEKNADKKIIQILQSQIEKLDSDLKDKENFIQKQNGWLLEKEQMIKSLLKK